MGHVIVKYIQNMRYKIYTSYFECNVILITFSWSLVIGLEEFMLQKPIFVSKEKVKPSIIVLQTKL